MTKNCNLYYTGIGSRKTPQHILEDMVEIARNLAKQHYVLRSGGADGADSAFEKGCKLENGEMEIYLPWKNFNNNSSNLIVESEKAFEIAGQFHPRYKFLKPACKKLMARNSHQILGKDLQTPSCFVVCYSEGSGGTEQALRIAKRFNIPIFNLFEMERKEIIEKILKNNYQEDHKTPFQFLS